MQEKDRTPILSSQGSVDARCRQYTEPWDDRRIERNGRADAATEGWGVGRAALVDQALDHVCHVLLAPLVDIEVSVRSKRLSRGATPRPHPRRLHLLWHWCRTEGAHNGYLQPIRTAN
jgi:hypothetical protein